MNNRSDFAPETRNQALWASDTRRIIDGKTAEVYLERTGQIPPADLSDKENVQWGLRLQDAIGREVSRRRGIELKDADYMLTHPKHSWMRSHFDFITADGTELIEVKNYSAHTRKWYGDDGTGIIKPADKAQLIHEAAVHGVTKATLAVLFGGQELCCYPFDIEEASKDDLIKILAVVWGQIQTRTPPDPSNSEEAAKLFPVSSSGSIMATQEMELVAANLAAIKAQIKPLEEAEDTYKTFLQTAMQGYDTLTSFDGRVLATWKSAKGTKRFDAKLFEQAMPDVYQRFVVDVAGSRRFLVK